ncbi:MULTISPECIES: hypothetical protein [Bradyrhizobium]|uniref:hypothetical protein n=1 Tax=Bradyrhizobium TaxID=374 RepID=UPI001141F531|nr:MULTISPECIES: hypothetical protein [Bradyrhizobium]QOG23419.1 hypothetical protein FOM02_45450 [Bradyrhizobium sp. SEMIA]UFW50442.1 hypothetical protein BaraCB756_05080 [Bradyrhizobium arachidis]
MEVIDRIAEPSEGDIERGLLQQIAEWKARRAHAPATRTAGGVRVERRLGRRSVIPKRRFDPAVR